MAMNLPEDNRTESYYKGFPAETIGYCSFDDCGAPLFKGEESFEDEKERPICEECYLTLEQRHKIEAEIKKEQEAEDNTPA